MAIVISCSDTGSHAEEEAEAKRITDSKDHGIRYDPCEQAQRSMLSAQQVVSEIQAAQQIAAGACDADSRDCVMVHSALFVCDGS
jgi:hypothetical protein